MCAEVCPVQVIDFDRDGFPEGGGYAYKLCINCGYCVNICPVDALKHERRGHSAVNHQAAVQRYNAMKKRKRELSDEK
ncbi:MAG: 4Fe-4S dicluster domain-containing protein [Lachnospiraceae bacterium]|nr:4Fe-4S dicluster domain-containing protein [Lachnospiraceae bacterium]